MELPIRALETEQIATDTFVTRLLYGEGINPVAVFVNSMIITGDEPVLVDVGPALVREEWLQRTFSVVEPEDVRWIFLSHDDVDHTGNLREVLEMCPNATIVCNWFMAERMGADYLLPIDRMRWVNHGETFRAGDRELLAFIPPTFDSPTTRGLFDPTTGVYWASDSFSSPVTHEVTNISQLDPGFWRESFSMMQRTLSPWHQWLDPSRYQAHLDRVRALGATTVATAHGPTLHGAQIASGLELLRELPYLPAAPQPGQADLEAAIRGLLGAITSEVPVAV